MHSDRDRTIDVAKRVAMAGPTCPQNRVNTGARPEASVPLCNTRKDFPNTRRQKKPLPREQRP